MKNNKQAFQRGVLTGILGSAIVIGLGFSGQYVYVRYQTQQILKEIAEQKTQFAEQITQHYLSSNNHNGQLLQLLRDSSNIQSNILTNLKPLDGIDFKFNQLQLMVSIQAHDKIPAALAQHHIYYQPQSLDGQTISSWQCFSDLDDKLRPEQCIYSKEQPDNRALLRQILSNTRMETPSYTGRSAHTPPVETDCTRFKSKLPSTFDIFAAGAYSGRKSKYQIDDSGHQATEMDIQVQHNRPVVLILGAYEPSIWNIKWANNTQIVGVIATGYHAQRVIGIPKSIPVLETTSENSQCGYSYISDDNAATINQLSQKILQQDIKTIVIAKNGQANIGELVAPDKLVSSQERTLKDIIDPKAPLAGPAGIQDAVAKGLLRPATRADIDAWKAASNRANNIHTPPVIGASPSSGTGMDYVHFHSAYVVLQEMTIPAGLYGAHSVTLFVPEGVPRPKGNPGHSTIYDIKSGACIGSSPDCMRR